MASKFYAILGGEGVGNASAVKGTSGMTRQMIDEKLRKIMIVILTMSKAVKFCPFCGISLDTEFTGIRA